MASILKKRTTLIWFAIALLVSAALDCVSTVYGINRIGGWHGEANPVFRALLGNEASNVAAVSLLICIKVIASSLAILWIAKVMVRIPDLYPQLGEKYGFFRFANNIFYGKDVPWTTSLFGIPPFNRIATCLSVPVATTIIVSGVAASITNTFGLLAGYSSVVAFWISTALLGIIFGMEFLRRDFLQLSEKMKCQHGNPGDSSIATRFQSS